MPYDGTPKPSAFIAYTPGQSVVLGCGCAGCVKAAQVWLNTHGDSELASKFAMDVLSPLGVSTGLLGLNQLAAKPTLTQLGLTSAIVDEQTADATTAGAVSVGGPRVVSTINTIGDVDAFRVTLEAGKTYDISVIQKLLGPTGVPNLDSFVTLTDLAGNVIGTADGGAPDTLTNMAGFDAKLTVTITQTGEYLIKAQAFDQDGTNGTTGDGVGDYEVFAVEADPSTAYRPYYGVDTPMHSIDWGSQKTGASRNPDGQEGSRPTGNAFVAPTLGAVEGAQGELAPVAGKNVLTYYFANPGDIFIDEDPTTVGTTENIQQLRVTTEIERAAYRNSFQQYANVADIVYVEITDPAFKGSADFVIKTYFGTPGPGVSLLGRASPPGEENAGKMEYNALDERYGSDLDGYIGLNQGGYFFSTLLHEMGHAHGLSHPHDNGGQSSVMPGADGGTAGLGGGFGDFLLSQSVFTVMSYNDGWSQSPYGDAPQKEGYGWQGTLAALDIAVIQDKYGVNEEFAAGDDVYELKDINAIGTFYRTIWDGGGTDTLRYSGSRNAVIDLRAASLLYAVGGAGYVSYAEGVFGGFTIANGAVIENATGGSGADVITGNDVANTLSGGFGFDTLSGGAGADVLYGNQDADVLYGNQDNDVLYGGQGNDAAYGGQGDDLVFGNLGDDVLAGNTGVNLLDGGDGSDTASYVHAAAGVSVSLLLAGAAQATGVSIDTLVGIENLTGSAFADSLTGDAAANILSGGLGADTLSGGFGADVLYGNQDDDVLYGNQDADALYGGQGNDVLYGGQGDDLLQGGIGADTLFGNLGVDTFRYFSVGDSPLATPDLLADFSGAQGDKIDLRAIRTGASDGFTLSFAEGTTTLDVDLGGDGVLDLRILVTGVVANTDVLWS